MHTIEEIENYAKEHFVPIARKQTTEFMLKLIKEKNYTSFLEIGTAIGYTSIILAKYFSKMKILTIEQDVSSALLAIENFSNFNVSSQIEMLIDDAITYLPKEKYDLIFIDASKKRNRFFLEKYAKYLNQNGTIIIDNMHLDDFWVGANKDKKEEYDRVNQEFKEYILSCEKFDCTIYDDIGDGIAVISLKNNCTI